MSPKKRKDNNISATLTLSHEDSLVFGDSTQLQLFLDLGREPDLFKTGDCLLVTNPDNPTVTADISPTTHPHLYRIYLHDYNSLMGIPTSDHMPFVIDFDHLCNQYMNESQRKSIRRVDIAYPSYNNANINQIVQLPPPSSSFTPLPMSVDYSHFHHHQGRQVSSLNHSLNTLNTLNPTAPQAISHYHPPSVTTSLSQAPAQQHQQYQQQYQWQQWQDTHHQSIPSQTASSSRPQVDYLSLNTPIPKAKKKKKGDSVQQTQNSEKSKVSTQKSKVTQKTQTQTPTRTEEEKKEATRLKRRLQRKRKQERKQQLREAQQEQEEREREIEKREREEEKQRQKEKEEQQQKEEEEQRQKEEEKERQQEEEKERQQEEEKRQKEDEKKQRQQEEEKKQRRKEKKQRRKERKQQRKEMEKQQQEEEEKKRKQEKKQRRKERKQQQEKEKEMQMQMQMETQQQQQQEQKEKEKENQAQSQTQNQVNNHQNLQVASVTPVQPAPLTRNSPLITPPGNKPHPIATSHTTLNEIPIQHKPSLYKRNTVALIGLTPVASNIQNTTHETASVNREKPPSPLPPELFTPPPPPPLSPLITASHPVEIPKVLDITPNAFHPHQQQHQHQQQQQQQQQQQADNINHPNCFRPNFLIPKTSTKVHLKGCFPLRYLTTILMHLRSDPRFGQPHPPATKHHQTSTSRLTQLIKHGDSSSKELPLISPHGYQYLTCDLIGVVESIYPFKFGGGFTVFLYDESTFNDNAKLQCKVFCNLLSPFCKPGDIMLIWNAAIKLTCGKGNHYHSDRIELLVSHANLASFRIYSMSTLRVGVDLSRFFRPPTRPVNSGTQTHRSNPPVSQAPSHKTAPSPSPPPPSSLPSSSPYGSVSTIINHLRPPQVSPSPKTQTQTQNHSKGSPQQQYDDPSLSWYPLACAHYKQFTKTENERLKKISSQLIQYILPLRLHGLSLLTASNNQCHTTGDSDHDDHNQPHDPLPPLLSTLSSSSLSHTTSSSSDTPGDVNAQYNWSWVHRLLPSTGYSPSANGASISLTSPNDVASSIISRCMPICACINDHAVKAIPVCHPFRLKCECDCLSVLFNLPEVDTVMDSHQHPLSSSSSWSSSSSSSSPPKDNNNTSEAQPQLKPGLLASPYHNLILKTLSDQFTSHFQTICVPNSNLHHTITNNPHPYLLFLTLLLIHQKVKAKIKQSHSQQRQQQQQDKDVHSTSPRTNTQFSNSAQMLKDDDIYHNDRHLLDLVTNLMDRQQTHARASSPSTHQSTHQSTRAHPQITPSPSPSPLPHNSNRLTPSNHHPPYKPPPHLVGLRVYSPSGASNNTHRPQPLSEPITPRKKSTLQPPPASSSLMPPPPIRINISKLQFGERELDSRPFSTSSQTPLQHQSLVKSGTTTTNTSTTTNANNSSNSSSSNVGNIATPLKPPPATQHDSNNPFLFSPLPVTSNTPSSPSPPPPQPYTTTPISDKHQPHPGNMDVNVDVGVGVGVDTNPTTQTNTPPPHTNPCPTHPTFTNRVCGCSFPPITCTPLFLGSLYCHCIHTSGLLDTVFRSYTSIIQPYADDPPLTYDKTKSILLQRNNGTRNGTHKHRNHNHDVKPHHLMHPYLLHACLLYYTRTWFRENIFGSKSSGTYIKPDVEWHGNPNYPPTLSNRFDLITRFVEVYLFYDVMKVAQIEHPQRLIDKHEKLIRLTDDDQSHPNQLHGVLPDGRSSRNVTGYTGLTLPYTSDTLTMAQLQVTFHLTTMAESHDDSSGGDQTNPSVCIIDDDDDDNNNNNNNGGNGNDDDDDLVVTYQSSTPNARSRTQSQSQSHSQSKSQPRTTTPRTPTPHLSDPLLHPSDNIYNMIHPSLSSILAHQLSHTRDFFQSLNPIAPHLSTLPIDPLTGISQRAYRSSQRDIPPATAKPIQPPSPLDDTRDHHTSPTTDETQTQPMPTPKPTIEQTYQRHQQHLAASFRSRSGQTSIQKAFKLVDIDQYKLRKVYDMLLDKDTTLIILTIASTLGASQHLRSILTHYYTLYQKNALQSLNARLYAMISPSNHPQPNSYVNNSNSNHHPSLDMKVIKKYTQLLNNPTKFLLMVLDYKNSLTRRYTRVQKKHKAPHRTTTTASHKDSSLPPKQSGISLTSIGAHSIQQQEPQQQQQEPQQQLQEQQHNSMNDDSEDTDTTPPTTSSDNDHIQESSTACTTTASTTTASTTTATAITSTASTTASTTTALSHNIIEPQSQDSIERHASFLSPPRKPTHPHPHPHPHPPSDHQQQSPPCPPPYYPHASDAPASAVPTPETTDTTTIAVCDTESECDAICDIESSSSSMLPNILPDPLDFLPPPPPPPPRPPASSSSSSSSSLPPPPPPPPYNDEDLTETNDDNIALEDLSKELTKQMSCDAHDGHQPILPIPSYIHHNDHENHLISTNVQNIDMDDNDGYAFQFIPPRSYNDDCIDDSDTSSEE